jgi:hypothetical protein
MNRPDEKMIVAPIQVNRSGISPNSQTPGRVARMSFSKSKGKTAVGPGSLQDWLSVSCATDPHRPMNASPTRFISVGVCQTHSAGPIEKAHRNMPIHATIATLVSVRDNILITIIATAQSATAPGAQGLSVRCPHRLYPRPIIASFNDRRWR